MHCQLWSFVSEACTGIDGRCHTSGMQVIMCVQHVSNVQGFYVHTNLSTDSPYGSCSGSITCHYICLKLTMWLWKRCILALMHKILCLCVKFHTNVSDQHCSVTSDLSRLRCMMGTVQVPQGLKQQLWVGSWAWENAFSLFQVIWLVARGFGARSEELRARSISHWTDRQTEGGYRACWRGHVWGDGGKDPMCLMTGKGSLPCQRTSFKRASTWRWLQKNACRRANTKHS